MANQEHLDILKQGVEVWNQWRKVHATIQPDLREAHLSRADLSGADLSGARLDMINLRGANLSKANLSNSDFRTPYHIILDAVLAELFYYPRADLSGANLSEANLSEANLSGIDLSGVDLSRTNLSRTQLLEANLERVNLSGADLSGANLSGVNLSGADLSGANLSGVNLSGMNLGGANLSGVNLSGMNLSGAYLWKANLSGTDLNGTDLSRADLRDVKFGKTKLRGVSLSGVNLSDTDLSGKNLYGVDLSGANLRGASVRRASLSGAIFRGADLTGVDLSGKSLYGADLSGAILNETNLIKTNFSHANLTDCSIYGIAAWDLRLDEQTIQKNLIITPPDQPVITIDNIKIAQFIYLLLNNKEIRDAIDTIARKAVLILGRFTPERKSVLDALRDDLRAHGYLPILFDFDKPSSQDFTETVSTLAHLSRFIVADLTDPSSIPQELYAIIPHRMVPVQPLLQESEDPNHPSREYSMFSDLKKKYHWVLSTHRYRDLEELLAALKEHVIEPAERKAKELAKLRAQEFEKQ